MATDKDFVVKNGLQVGTTANVSGNVNACSALTVAGLTTLSSNVNVDSGTLFVDTSANRVGVNTASPDVALTVQGSANVSVNLRVGGNLIIAGNTETVGTTISTGNFIPTDNTYFLGNTTNRWSIFAKSFTSDGAAAISSTLASGNVTVTGFANISTTLAVTGAATLSSTLSVTGNTVISGTANVTGAVALANTLGATGAVTFANTFTVTGLANLNSGINTTFVNASANLTVGANVLVDTAKLFIGNSTVNTTHNVTTVQISNSTSTANLSAIDLKIGTTTVNSTAVGVGANVILSTSEVSVGNSTVNTRISASEVLGYSNAYFNVISSNGNILVGNSTVNVTVNSSQFNVGSNVNLTPSRFNVGNSTVNTFITATAIETDGTLGVLGVATFSNNVTIAGNLTVSGTTTYVNTTTLNISDNIITLNADLAATNAPTESAGIEINRGSSANVILQWNETTDAWELTSDGSTYSNIATVAYASNATNISSGTLNTARLPSQVNVATQVYVGANVSLNATVIAVGNSTVYSNISGGTISVTGLATTGNLNTTTANSTTLNVTGLATTGNLNTTTANATTLNVTGLATTGNLNTTIANATTMNATTVNANTAGIHTGNVAATQVNASANVITPTLYGNVVATYVSASANVTVGANVIANLTTIAVGNSTVYSNVAGGTINVTGLATTGNINSTVANVTTLNVTGLATTGNLNTTTANITTLNATTSIAGAANLALTGVLHTLSGNVNVDSGLLFVDGTNNRVGINNSAPDASLTVTGTANVSGAVRIAGVTTHAANVAMANNYLTEPTLKSYKEYTESGGTVTTAYTANLALSNIFTLTGTNGSNCVFTFGSPPASGNAQMFTIVFKQPATGSANVTWPAAVKWSYGDTPVISSTVNARDVFTFLTFDGGTTYLGAYSMANVAS